MRVKHKSVALVSAQHAGGVTDRRLGANIRNPESRQLLTQTRQIARSAAAHQRDSEYRTTGSNGSSGYGSLTAPPRGSFSWRQRRRNERRAHWVVPGVDEIASRHFVEPLTVALCPFRISPRAKALTWTPSREPARTDRGSRSSPRCRSPRRTADATRGACGRGNRSSAPRSHTCALRSPALAVLGERHRRAFREHRSAVVAPRERPSRHRIRPPS